MKKILFLGLIFCFLFTIQAAEKVTRLGQHPFYKSRNIQPGDLKIIAVDKAGDVKMGFEEAGNGELVFAFLEQIQKADIQTVELNPGDGLQWMLFKKGKKVQVMKDVVWDGKKPVAAYGFTIFRDGKTYEFIVPKICGNISLKNTQEIPAPVCALTVSPEQVEIGLPVKIEVCGSQNALKSTVTIKDAAGTVIKTLDLTPENCTAEFTFDKAGEYTISDIAEGQYAMKSVNPCEVAIKVTEATPIISATQEDMVKYGTQKPLSFLIEGGPGLLKGTYTGMVWARGGLVFNIAPDSLDFILSLGGGIPIKGAPWKSFLMGNALLNLHLGPAYVAGGLGFSTKEREERKGGIDLVGEVGINLFQSGTSIGSIFGELRAPVLTKDRSFELHHKLLLGFRYIF
jgi:plastocyanin